jgi:hypothetical protein
METRVNSEVWEIRVYPRERQREREREGDDGRGERRYRNLFIERETV